MDIYIKNMVCPRCIMAVKDIMQQLNITTLHIQLGLVTIAENLTDHQLEAVGEKLNEIGFELLNDNQKQLVEQIKTLILEQIYNGNGTTVPLAQLLPDKLHKDYSALSKLFSSTEGITIEQYNIQQKVEHIKELLTYDQLTLSQIADQMGYSSVAHISAQFKKITGMTPSEFKTQGIILRLPIDSAK